MASTKGRPKGTKNPALNPDEIIRNAEKFGENADYVSGFAIRLNEKLSKKGVLSFTDLCVATGIEKPRMSEYRSGKVEPKLSAIIRIAKALNVDVESLVIGTNPKRYEISQYTGLKDNAIENLRRLSDQAPDDMSMLNTLLSAGTDPEQNEDWGFLSGNVLYAARIAALIELRRNPHELESMMNIDNEKHTVTLSESDSVDYFVEKSAEAYKQVLYRIVREHYWKGEE